MSSTLLQKLVLHRCRSISCFRQHHSVGLHQLQVQQRAVASSFRCCCGVASAFVFAALLPASTLKHTHGSFGSCSANFGCCRFVAAAVIQAAVPRAFTFILTFCVFNKSAFCSCCCCGIFLTSSCVVCFLSFFGGGFFYCDDNFLISFFSSSDFSPFISLASSSRSADIDVSRFLFPLLSLFLLSGMSIKKVAHNTPMVTSHVDHVIGLSVFHIPQVSSFWSICSQFAFLFLSEIQTRSVSAVFF